MTYTTPYPQILKRITLAVLSLVLTSTSIPVALADTNENVAQTTTISSSSNDNALLDQDTPALPLRTYKVDMTAYTSAVDECDADPWTTASGFNLQPLFNTASTEDDVIVAANFLPFGTKIRIPELFGDKVFVVHDRMNSRYWQRVDVWMKDKKVARQFGLHHNVKIEIVEMGDGKTLYAKRAEEKKLARLKTVEAEKLKTQLASIKK